MEWIIGRDCLSDYCGEYIRYPLNFFDREDDAQYKIRGKMEFSLDEDETKRLCRDGLVDIYYTFGINRLMIAEGIVESLNFLERRYGLNFIELEKNMKLDLKNIRLGIEGCLGQELAPEALPRDSPFFFVWLPQPAGKLPSQSF